MYVTLPSDETSLSRGLIGFGGRPSRCEALRWAPGWRTGPSFLRQEVHENPEQNISEAFVPASRAAAQLEPVLASNLVANLSVTARSRRGLQGCEQRRNQVVTSSSPPVLGKFLPANSGARERTSAPAFSESQLSLLTAHSLELILASSSRSPSSTAVTAVHRFCPRAFRGGMIG